MPQAPKLRTTRARSTVTKEPLIEESVVSEKRKKKISVSPSTLILGVLLLAAVGAAGYFYYQSKHAAQIADSKEIEELTKTIGQFLELPEGETPTLATVTDKEKLSDQTFFLKAENGDKVLIYSGSGKAILYRPSTKKIVDMTSVNVNQPGSEQQPVEQKQSESVPTSPVSEAPQAATIALYNGGTKIGVTDATEKQITAGFPDVQVVAKEKAVKTDYAGNIIVDISGRNQEKVANLAQLLGATVGSLPPGEVTPQADIAIIIGNTEAPTAVPAPEENKKN